MLSRREDNCPEDSDVNDGNCPTLVSKAANRLSRDADDGRMAVLLPPVGTLVELLIFK